MRPVALTVGVLLLAGVVALSVIPWAPRLAPQGRQPLPETQRARAVKPVPDMLKPVVASGRDLDRQILY